MGNQTEINRLRRALQEPGHSDFELEYLKNVTQNTMTPFQALKACGLQGATARALCTDFENSPKMLAAVEGERRKYEQQGLMTRKKVLEGFLEAIEIGKLKADSVAMTTGWREVAKLCGYYEPVKHKLEVSVQGEVVLHKLQSLDDQKLLQLVEGDTDALDGEFKVLE